MLQRGTGLALFELPPFKCSIQLATGIGGGYTCIFWEGILGEIEPLKCFLHFLCFYRLVSVPALSCSVCIF